MYIEVRLITSQRAVASVKPVILQALVSSKLLAYLAYLDLTLASAYEALSIDLGQCL